MKLSFNAKVAVCVVWVGCLVGMGYSIGVANLGLGIVFSAIFVAMTIVIDNF